MYRFTGVRTLSGRSALGLTLMGCAAVATAQGESGAVALERIGIDAKPAPEGYRTEQSASAKYAVPLLEVPQTVTVVPQQVMREQNALSLRRVLSNVSGISFNAGEGGGGSGDSINIRGFSANANLQIDGLRDTAQTSRTDLFNLESVEVIKGPNSVFGGAGTTGGSVNMITKLPQAEAFTELGTGIGTDRYRRLTLDTNQPLQGLGDGTLFRLNLMVHENHVPGRDQIQQQRWGLAPSLMFGHGSDTRLTLSYFHQSDDNLPDYGLPARDGKRLAGVKTRNYYGWRNLDQERADTDSLTVKFEHDFNDDWTVQNLSRIGQVDRDATISASHVNLAIVDKFHGRYQPAGPQAYRRDVQTRLAMNQTSLTGHFDALGVGHTLVMGAELSRETYDRKASGYDLKYPSNGYDLANPPGYWSGEKARSPVNHTHNSMQDQALYALDTLALNDEWDLSLGLRYDHMTARANNRNAGKDRVKASSTDGVFSQRAGLVYKPADNGRFYVAYGTSFNPSAENLLTSGGGLSASTVSLAPERGKTWELGTKWLLLDDRLQLEGALFRVVKDHVRERLSDGTSLLAGKQQVQGFELAATGALTDRWHVFANYTLQSSETLKSTSLPKRVGQALSNTPPRSFNLWTAYELPGDITLAYGVRHVGKRNVTSQDHAKVDAYWVHDAMLGYKATANLDLQLNLSNLANTRYVERVRTVAGTDTRSSAVEYGDGRAAVLSTVYRF